MNPKPAIGFDNETRAQISASLRELFASRGEDQDIAPMLADLGWVEVAAEDPRTAVALLFTEHGRALATSRALDDVVLAALPDLASASGGRLPAVVYPHPAELLTLPPPQPTVDGVVLGSLDGVDEIVIAGTTGMGSVEVVVVPADCITATEPVKGFDLGSAWTRVTGELPAHAAVVGAQQDWDLALAAARRALAAEILGICDVVLEMTVAHASARVQFGRRIGSFQAVRHRLAEAAVAIAGARSVLQAALGCTLSGEVESWEATVAKQRAGQAQAVVMRHAVQVFGAMGLTQENRVHRYVQRSAALDAFLGSHQMLAETIGSSVSSGTVPAPTFQLL